MSRRKRKHISLTTKLAAALLFQPVRDRRGRPVLDADGCLTYAITYAEARTLTAEQVLSLFQYDHDTLHALDGSDEFWNLTPRLISAHREKSKVDCAKVAKTKRIRAAKRLADNRGSLLHATARAPRGARMGKAIIPGSKASPYKRKFNGTVERRAQP